MERHALIAGEVAAQHGGNETVIAVRGGFLELRAVRVAVVVPGRAGRLDIDLAESIGELLDAGALLLERNLDRLDGRKVVRLAQFVVDGAADGVAAASVDEAGVGPLLAGVFDGEVNARVDQAAVAAAVNPLAGSSPRATFREISITSRTRESPG